jgi:hypothetical protein
LNDNVPEPPEPKGKLDTVTVNGPEGEDLGWDAIVWPVHEELVRRLRCRIFKASKAGDLATVRNLPTPDTPPGACLSRMPRRVARTDLRGPRCSNAPGLPDVATHRYGVRLVHALSCRVQGCVRGSRVRPHGAQWPRSGARTTLRLRMRPAP